MRNSYPNPDRAAGFHHCLKRNIYQAINFCGHAINSPVLVQFRLPDDTTQRDFPKIVGVEVRIACICLVHIGNAEGNDNLLADLPDQVFLPAPQFVSYRPVFALSMVQPQEEKQYTGA